MNPSYEVNAKALHLSINMIDMQDTADEPVVTVQAYFSKTLGSTVYSAVYRRELAYRFAMVPRGVTIDLRNESDSIVRPSIGCDYADTAHAWPPTASSAVIDTVLTWTGDTTRTTYMDLYRMPLPDSLAGYRLDSVEVTKWGTARTLQLPLACQPPESITRNGVMVLRAITAEGTVVRHW